MRTPTLMLVSSAVWKREGQTKELLELIKLMKESIEAKGAK